MFAVLHGTLAPHPWRDPESAEADAYSLFHARSSAMRLLTAAVEGASGGVWGMNDAGADSPVDADSSRIAWFQVGITDHAERFLPVQAFLSCADAVLERIGTSRLDAVQILLPLDPSGTPQQAVSDASATPGIAEAHWFADPDPGWRTEVRVTLDGGRSESPLASVAATIAARIQETHQAVFACESVSLAGESDLALQPAAYAGVWPGPSSNRATLHGTLTEWSLDAVGWLVGFLADVVSQHSVSGDVMVTVSRNAPISVRV